jgi:hypothetical protein
MANVEEILFKMGIRTEALMQGINNAKAEVTKLGEHLDKKLSPKSGEGLINVFNEITNLSPMLGAAMTAAFNPITGGFQLATQVFTAAKARLMEWNAELDKQGDIAARPVGKMRDLLLVGQDKASANRQGREWWENDLLNGKPGEVEQERIRKRVEEARVASGGDPLKFSQAKLAIMEEEKLLAEQQKLDALERQRTLAQAGESPETIAKFENRKAKIQDQIKEEERLTEEIKKQEAIVKELARLRDAPLSAALESFTKDNPLKGTEFDPMIGVAATGIGATVGDLIPGNSGERDEWVQKAQEKLDDLMRTRRGTTMERKTLEQDNIEESELIRENIHNLQETQSEADKAKMRSLELDRAIDAEKKALFEAERNRRNEDTENAIKQAEKKAGANKLAFIQEKLAIQQSALTKAQSLGDDEQARKLSEALKITEAERETEAINKAKAQEKFERDYAYQGTRIEQSRLSQDQITVDQLAAMPSWGGGFSATAQAQGFQHNMDRQLLAMGGGVAGQFSDTAREYQLAQEESQMALLVSGKDSDRYKRAKLREESLQKDLGESGIVKIDVSMMKMAKAQEDLLEMARKEGLVVKPQMGK